MGPNFTKNRQLSKNEKLVVAESLPRLIHSLLSVFKVRVLSFCELFLHKLLYFFYLNTILPFVLVGMVFK